MVAAYCRVSTDKTDQLNSLEMQKQFFSEFTQRNGHTLVQASMPTRASPAPKSKPERNFFA